LTAEQIVASVPQAAEYAQIETQQFSNVPSGLITPAQWLALSRRIDEALRRPDLAGVIVTHGTVLATCVPLSGGGTGGITPELSGLRRYSSAA
jgi:hypothetical protein